MSRLLHHTRKSSYTLLSLLALSFAAACGDAGTAPARTVASVIVSPDQQSLLIGEQKGYTARALDAAGKEILGRPITWGSSDATVASVSPAGVVTALGRGTTFISATIDGRVGSGALDVALVPVSTVSIDPDLATIVEGETRTLAATAKDAAGHVLEGRAVTWSSTNPAAATVTAGGIVTAVAPGEAIIRAVVEGKQGDATVTVTATAVATIELSAATLFIEEGEGSTVVATPKAADGRVLQGRPLTWRSADPTIATVDAAGRITAVRAGRTNISATSGAATASLEVKVTPPAVASVSVSPAAFVLEIGESRPMQAVVKDARGNTLLNRAVQWSVDGTSASITPNGLLLGVRNGHVTVTATVEGVVAGVGATVVTGEPYAWELIYNRVAGNGTSEIFILGLGSGTAPVKLNAGNVSRHATPSPNGNRIAFAVSMQDLTTNDWIHDIFAVDRNGMNMKRLTSVAGSESEPAWSPAGGRIAYTHFAPSGRSDIWVMHEDGTGAINLTADLPADAMRDGATWSPDGSRIAFRQVQSGPGGSTFSVFTMRADGSDRREVTGTTTGFDSTPSWSPDGQWLAVTRYYTGGDADITLVPVTGGAARRLALPGMQSMPAWSPDGTMLAFVQDDPGRQNVYTMLADGSRVRLRTVDPAWGGGVSPAWIRKP